MARAANVEVVEDAENHKIVQAGFDALVVPRYSDKEIRSMYVSRELSEQEDVMIFDSQDRAQTWVALLESVGASYEEEPISERAEDWIGASEDRNVSIPLPVAVEGRAKIAAYLFASGWRVGAISNLFDVRERTVRQYLSDVRRGER